MNVFKRFMSMLLVLCMLISVVPMTALAAETDSTDPAVAETTEETMATTEETKENVELNEKTISEEIGMLSVEKSTSNSSDFLKVFHLDCGRKYFTVDQIKEILDALSNAGFSHMELAIGNDGLRLLLDDMTIEANNTTYNSDTIKSGIQSGNRNYSHSGEWSENEMDTIIAYAKTKGIEIIPLINNPGHMDSILAAMKACGIDGYYKSSVRTVDLENEEAVAFTQALVMKYAEYFADKGCNYFNIGADEYANDYHTSDSSGMGFGYLVSKNKYGNFVDYVNTLVEDICALGMTPIAFNDGIYYNSTTNQGTFDNRLVVAAWTGGWGGIVPAKTDFLVEKGHQILNTNERWYYVPSASSGYTYNYSLGNAQSVDVTTVTDNTGVSPIGAMQCVWFDYPNVDYETYKSNIMTLISTLAENNPTYFTGPNEVTPAPEPDVPEDVGSVTDNGVTVSAIGLTGLTVTEATAPVIEGANAVLAWNITPVTADGNYTGSAKISVPVPDDWSNVRGGVLASENGPEVMGIEGKLENGVFTFNIPHFSTGVVYDVDAIDEDAYDTLVELTVGQMSKTYTDNSGYYTTANGLDTTIASVSLGGSAGSEATVKYTATSVTCSNLLNSNSTYQATDYYVLADDGKYYPLYVSRTSHRQGKTIYYNYTYHYSTDGGESFEDFGTQPNLSSTNTNANITVYTKSGTEAVPAKTTVAFTGISVGTTYATIGSTTYKIVVSKKTESATITVGDTKTYTDSSTNSPVVTDTKVLDAVLENGTLTITAKEVGTTTITTDNAVYTIEVVEFDPSTVTPLTVEYWITNLTTRTVESTTNNPVISQQISAGMVGVATANGADINAMMPEWTIKKDGDSGDDREVEFWHVRMLDKTVRNNSTNRTQEQTTDSADDETTSGYAVTRVRYYDPGDGNGRRWQLLSNTNWLDVNLSNNQIVAYYMEVLDIKNAKTDVTEVHVNSADWGKLGDGTPASSYADTSKYCSISLQIVYEDGTTTNPASTTAADLDSKTILFNYWDNGRGIGTFAFDTMGQFKIYQITAETGAVTASFSGGAWGTAQVTNFTWDNNEKVVWDGNSETASIYNNTSNPSSEGALENLMWNENREAILIRIYVKAIENPNSLTVHYMDRSANDLEFYNYFITTPDNEVFKEGFDMTGNGLELVNNNVTNYYDGEQRYVSADLQTMPEIKAYYRYCNYTLVDVERSEDGKNVYLYYTFTPVVSFVADFGLPIQITPNDLNQDGYATNVSDIKSVQVIGSKDSVASSNANAEYGKLTVNGTTVTYTPTQILQNVDFFSIYVETTADNPNTTTNESAGINYRVYIFPATTVYYEESFLTYDSNWTGGNADISVGTQTTEKLGEKQNIFGYEDAYNGAVKGSNGTNAYTEVMGANASFTFNGTGFELYANSKPTSGYVSVYSQGELSKLYMINTELNVGDTNATSQQNGDTYYSLPIISETNLPYGTYTVQIKKTKGSDPIYIDGIRIINTLEDSTVFTDDEEDCPVFYELRDYVLNAIGVEDLTQSDYIDSADRIGKVDAVKDMAGQVYNALGEDDKAIVINKEGTSFTKDQAQDLLENGPKNELYLYPGQTLAFSVTTNRVMQLGMKSPIGSAKFKLIVDNKEFDLNNLSTTVDMFYKIAEKGGTTHTVSLTVSEGVLSVTLLKICDDPNAAFNALTQQDIENALLGIYGLNEEEDSNSGENSGEGEDSGETEHNYIAEVTDPTCTEGGYTTYTCSDCGDTYVDDETEALGHKYTEETVEGEKVYTCETCGDTYTEKFDNGEEEDANITADAEKNEESDKETNTNKETPDTGDHSQPVMYLLLMVVAMVGLAVMVAMKKKSEDF